MLEVEAVSDSFVHNLEAWVKRQKITLDAFKQVEESAKDADRLELIVLTRAAFQHMARTLSAFDQWLQDPFIISHMPREMLAEVWQASRKILYELLELDIKHTSAFKELIEKLSVEGRLNPILAQVSKSERKPTPQTTI